MGQAAIRFNAAGPSGATGAQGAVGATGPAGPSSSDSGTSFGSAPISCHSIDLCSNGSVTLGKSSANMSV